MGQVSYTIPTIGQPNSSEDADVRDALVTIKSTLNGNIDNDNIDTGVTFGANNLTTVLQAALGVTSSYRGYASVATAEFTSSTSWTDLTTVGPSVTLTASSNGLFICYLSFDGSSLAEASGTVGINVTTDHVLSGLPEEGETVASFSGRIGSGPTNNTQGMAIIPVTAGSRTVSLKYSSNQGNPIFSDRKLWVLSLDF